MLIILAHGAAGPWDEVLLAGIAIVFIGFVGYSWYKSREFEPEENESVEDAE